MKEETTTQEMSHEIDNTVSQEQNQEPTETQSKEEIFSIGDSEAEKLLNNIVNKDELFESLIDTDQCDSESPDIKDYLSLANKLCEEHDDDLIIKDSVYEAIDDLKKEGIDTECLDNKFLAKDHVFKNSNVQYVNGIPEVRGPIIKVLNNHVHEEATPNESPILDTEEAENLAARFGSSNYSYSITLDDNNDLNSKLEQSSGLQGLIPDTHDKKMFCSENELDFAKQFSKDNKFTMQKQMNVVALYSIKDAKPFYYMSSAEARMAIEYVTLCRRFHTDVVAQNSLMINNVVLKVDKIIQEIQDSQRYDIPEMQICGDDIIFDGDIRIPPSDYIHSIYRTEYMPHTFNEFNIKYGKYRSLLDRRSTYAARSIVDLNYKINVLEPFMHYIVGGKNSIKLLLTQEACKGASSIERQLFGIVGNMKVLNSDMPIFHNYNIEPNSIVIISKRFTPNDVNNQIIINEYYLQKIKD